MIHLYHEAERNSLMVAGTTNRTEYLLGDFCKYGDGGTDVEPIAHLYKNQIYQLAGYLGVTADIINRSPSPDTFSLPLTTRSFSSASPLTSSTTFYAWEHGIGVPEASSVLGLSDDAVRRAYADFTFEIQGYRPSEADARLDTLRVVDGSCCCNDQTRHLIPIQSAPY
jgi:NAD+ synthase